MTDQQGFTPSSEPLVPPRDKRKSEMMSGIRASLRRWLRPGKRAALSSAASRYEEFAMHRLLATVLWWCMVLALLDMLLDLLISPHALADFGIAMVVFGISGIGLLLLRHQPSRTVAIYAVVCFWLFLAVETLFVGGVTVPDFAGFIVIVLLAGLVLSRGWLIGVMVATILYGLLLSVLEVNGLIPERISATTPSVAWMIYTFFILLSGGLVWAGSRLVQSSTSEIRSHERMLIASNRDLRRLRSVLEERATELAETNTALNVEVAERAQAEAELQRLLGKIERAKREWEVTADALSELIVLVDADGRILRINRAVERWAQVPVTTAVGASIHELLHPACQGCTLAHTLQQLVGAAVRGDTAHQEIYDAVLQRHLRVRARPLTKDLVAPAAVVVIYDVSQAKQVEMENTHLYERLVQQNRSLEEKVAERTADLMEALRHKDDFLAYMSHELRTPLSTIMITAQLLERGVRGSLNQGQKQALQTIERSGQHLLSLINDILDFSRLEAGKISLVFEPVDVRTACEESLDFIRGAAQEKNLTVEFTFDQAVTTVDSDSRRLKQMLINLLNNATKFTLPGGAVGLEVRGEPEPARLYLTVWDTGIGIAAEQFDKLFQPFTQLDTGTTRQYEGTGLGLTLVQRMVNLHGGSIAVESHVGQGSRFTIALPWQPVDPPTAAHAPLGGGRPLRVLVAAEHQTDVDRYRALLSDLWGAPSPTLDHVTTSFDLLDRCEESTFDLLIVDAQLTNPTALDVLSRLRDLRHLRQATVVVAGAVMTAQLSERFLAAGADDFLAKPLSQADLARCLDGSNPLAGQSPASAATDLPATDLPAAKTSE